MSFYGGGFQKQILIWKWFSKTSNIKANNFCMEHYYTIRYNISLHALQHIKKSHSKIFYAAIPFKPIIFRVQINSVWDITKLLKAVYLLLFSFFKITFCVKTNGSKKWFGRFIMSVVFSRFEIFLKGRLSPLHPPLYATPAHLKLT